MEATTTSTTAQSGQGWLQPLPVFTSSPSNPTVPRDDFDRLTCKHFCPGAPPPCHQTRSAGLTQGFEGPCADVETLLSGSLYTTDGRPITPSMPGARQANGPLPSGAAGTGQSVRLRVCRALLQCPPATRGPTSRPERPQASIPRLHARSFPERTFDACASHTHAERSPCMHTLARRVR